MYAKDQKTCTLKSWGQVYFVSTFNDKNIIYDNNGNMTSVTNSCGTTNYTWDVRNRLVGINGFKPDCSTLTASFKYDTFNRRIEKTINGITTQYLYDGVDVIQEIRGNAKTNYIRTRNIDEPLARIKADGTIRYYQQDALGSVISLTTDKGELSTVYIYDPFGNTTISGEASDNPFQYTGRENDGTGLYYYRARYYSSELQRFISEDSLQCERRKGENLYGYVENNPVNLTDPLGLSAGINPPPNDKWPPPPGDCPMCYAELVIGYYYCNVQWSNCHLCGTGSEECRKAVTECKKMAYERYKRCCKK